MMVFSPLSGRVVGHRGPRLSLLLGGTAMLAAGLVSAIPAGEPTDLRLFLGYALLGTGLGWANAAITNTAVAGMPREQAGRRRRRSPRPRGSSARRSASRSSAR